MTSIDATRVTEFFGMQDMISRRLALQGELTARGNSLDMLKKTAQGVLGLRLENGVISQFTAISRIFSLLNLSQLFPVPVT
jgi:uncharacterized protein involved in outer membrane biogenesis